MGSVVFATQVPAITASSAYATGNALGGLLSFGGLFGRGSGVISSILILDSSNQKAAIDLLLFSASFTATTDKSAINISSADLQKMVACVSIAAGDYVTVGTSTAIATKGNLGLGVAAASAGTATMFGQMVVRGTPTYTSTTAVTVQVNMLVG